MIIGENRPAVIKNIKAAATNGDFYKKVELNDPVISAAQAKDITDKYLSSHKTFSYKSKAFLARCIADAATAFINKNTEIIGEIDCDVLKNGAIITSNHFSPIENTSYVR